MDICIGNVLHQMTLSFLEFEKASTAHLPTEAKTFEEALEYFTSDTVLITSEFNKKLYDHYQYVTVTTVGRFLGENIKRFSWLKKVFPAHHIHPNSNTSSIKSTLFTQKPLNYSENTNRDMLLIMDHIQLQYLNFVAEQADDPEVYKNDVKIIYSTDVDKYVREAAEERVKVQAEKAGVAILHGDLLTDVRFETCKRLRRLAVTARERYDFLTYFRLGTFHMAMNKIIQDIGAGMTNEVNVDDLLSLGYQQIECRIGSN